MLEKGFVFAGNRFYVLGEMLRLGVRPIKIYAVPNSWLERTLLEKRMVYTALPEKRNFVDELEELSFDFLIANGLPHILPVSRLRKDTEKQFINIHPSCLPDLKGADPQPAALLFGRDSGATCHYMNDAIDAGDIISKIKIEYETTMDAGLLYQLTFRAEKEVFNRAWHRKFAPMKKEKEPGKAIYYSFREKHLQIDFSDSAREIARRVKAFNTPNKMARFTHDGREWRVGDASILHNSYMRQTFLSSRENEIVLCYQNNIVIKKQDKFLALKHLKSDHDKMPAPGKILYNEILKQGVEDEVE